MACITDAKLVLNEKYLNHASFENSLTTGVEAVQKKKQFKENCVNEKQMFELQPVLLQIDPTGKLFLIDLGL